MSKRLNLLLLLIFSVFCYLFTFFFLRNESSLYPCDFVDQNLYYYDFGSLLISNPIEFFKQFFSSIYSQNRNPFLNIFLFPFYFIFKESRFGFVLAIEIMFMIPVMVLLFNMIKKYFVNDDKEKDILFEIFLYSAVFFFPAIWLPVLSGIPDICGLVFILFAFFLYYKNKFSERLNFKTILLISILLYLSFLSRRWYSVVIFSFLSAIFLESLIRELCSYNNLKAFVKRIFNTVLNLSFISILVSVFACLFQWHYVRELFRGEMAERALYSLQQTQIPNLTYYILGNLCLFVLVIGLIFGIKNSKLRFVFLNLFIYLFAFLVLMNNQFLWINHYLYVAICVIAIYCFGIFCIKNKINNSFIKNFIIIFFIVYNFVNFITFFIIQKPTYLEPFLPLNTHYSVQNENYGKIVSLLSYLEKESQSNKDIRVVQYGLNSSVGYYQFRSIFPQSEFIKNNIISEYALDSDIREDIEADFVIILTPLGLYADESYCLKIIEIANQFINGYGIAKNYELVEKFDVTGDSAQVNLYKRIQNRTEN